ncbi:hypothetical protein [Sinorhizobium sp. BJ1]|uniref:hypothetical protein n=1 Tax=Sinorhizobium sp. BJ1 TaxID=2035455 RepID=UPI00118472DB|nr:hypothetical protein [Sinorhizobium sp. BJ1]
MKELYVSTYRMNGREMVMIYTTAQHLLDHAGESSLGSDHWIGTIDRVDLPPEANARLVKVGWLPMERPDFDRDHGDKLMPR